MAKDKTSKYMAASIQVEPHDWKNIQLIAKEDSSSANYHVRKAIKEYNKKYFANKGLV